MVDSKKVIDLRTQRAWTQQRLADVANVSLRTIQRLESGERSSSETVRAVAKALGVNVEVLFRETSAKEGEKLNQPIEGDFLPRIFSGTELLDVIGGCHMYGFEYDDPRTPEEMEQVGGFLQLLQDVGDILSDLEMAGRVEMGFELQTRLEEMQQSGFWVFGKAVKKPYLFGSEAQTVTFRTGECPFLS